jgi:hypothetical protein
MSIPPPLIKELYITLLTMKIKKIEFNTVSKITGIKREMIKDHLQGLCNVEIQDGAIILDDTTWSSLLENAIREGVLLFEVASKISWQRFEALTEEALKRHEFKTRRNLRFESEGKRWEIDVIGVRGDNMICFDCKQWKKHHKASMLIKSAKEQVNRVSALTRIQIKPIALKSERNVIKIYPALITLLDINQYILAGCFIVPVLKLNNFLDVFYELRDLIKPFKAITD